MVCQPGIPIKPVQLVGFSLALVEFLGKEVLLLKHRLLMPPPQLPLLPLVLSQVHVRVSVHGTLTKPTPVNHKPFVAVVVLASLLLLPLPLMLLLLLILLLLLLLLTLHTWLLACSLSLGVGMLLRLLLLVLLLLPLLCYARE